MNAVVYARFFSHRQGEQSIEGMAAYFFEQLSQNVRRGMKISA